MKKTLNDQGFTLIELLVVLMILTIVGGVALGIITGTLRGINKASSVNNIRQNGNYALSQISKTIAYAQNFCGVSTDNNPGILNNSCDVNGTNGSTYITDCPSTSTTVYKYIRVQSFDGGTTVYSCNGQTDSPPYTIASNGASLVDSSLYVTNCQILCNGSGTGVSPLVTISFTVQTFNPLNPAQLAEQKSSLDFETSVQPRNSN